ncbi:MAG: monofunctional biosynthetic peptidoglycan transglycosylase [Marichromatium sp.]|nr:monofunctional biosynthetic peptidoglycan transglycosylase [Marichromatium sp.]
MSEQERQEAGAVDTPGPSMASAAAEAPGSRPSRLRSMPGRARCWLRRCGRGLLVLAVTGVLGSALLVGALRWVDPPASAFMLQHAYNLWRLDQSPPYYHHCWVPWSELPPPLRLAAISGEDQRFPSHLGFDLIEIRHALAAHRQGGALRGASTITQQTAKNLFLWPGQGWGRKAIEAWFTLLLEVLWSKERILEVYLNIIQFSPSTYGAGAASVRYFGHPARTLTLEESALLIGVLPAPGHYRLDRPSERLRRRADWIIDQSSRLGGERYLGRL